MNMPHIVEYPQINLTSLPLVEMGLFMDADGIPLSMCITSGSDNEQTTAIPLENKLVKMFKGKNFCYLSLKYYHRQLAGNNSLSKKLPATYILYVITSSF